ncbi:MAG TPA: hypothetical protein PLO05_10860 [Bacteroidales bacterium]|nr:hypothetical protein [Bacteroidales bacterium]MDD4235789.1 hypothetical protein [Bacteroidales bacterium]HRW22166.1 hypothetical protein [Bacteroidales bacterium]HXK82646.1 hypothetical protein [Bacteroidales bacterium]
MKDSITNWSDNEFRTYLLLYCAYIDMFEHNDEKKLIKEKVGKDLYKKMHEEFDKDKDVTRLHKIQNTIKRLDYSKEQKKSLIADTMELFLSDGKFTYMEQYLQKQLKRILR